MSTLGYYENRGIAQPIRYLLSYLKVNFTEKLYGGDASEWFAKDKQTLNTIFPNLPYYVDENITLTESSAIPMYLIRKHKRLDLIGQNDDGSLSEKEISFGQVMGVLYDLRGKLFFSVFYQDFKSIKNTLLEEQLSVLYNRLLKQLQGKEYLVETLTYADFVFYDLICHLKYLYPEIKVPREYLERVENIAELKQYLESPKGVKLFLPEYYESKIRS